MKQQEFLQQVKDTVVEAVKEARSNPNGTLAQPVAATPFVPAAPVTPAHKQTERSARRQRDKILAAVDDALSALDAGREDDAADILDDVLEEYSDDDEDQER